MPSASRFLHALTLAASLGCAQAAAQDIDLDTSPALRCLTPASNGERQPAYPTDALRTDLGGRVQVALDFTVAEGAPLVTVLMRDSSEYFVQAVRQHVRTWRVPCLAEAGGRARLVFDFLFRPDDRKVVWTTPDDVADEGRREMLRCVVHVSGEKGPEYHRRAQQMGVRGNVYAMLRFVAPDQPPIAELLGHRHAADLVKSSEAWVNGLRMPCLAGGDLRASWMFMYRFEGDSPFGFRPMTLLQYMAHVKDLDKQTVEFDTRTMSCPFDLRLRYLQPQASNRVGQVGDVDPARQALIAWLESSELQLRGTTALAVYADEARITVPCVKINLKPKE